MSGELISLKNITKTYDGENYVLNGINLDVEYGELIAIRGKSGSGKSTLMNIIGLLDKQTSGDYMFVGKKVEKNKNHENIRGSKISFIFQSYNLIENYSVWDNVMMPFLYNSTRISKGTIEETNRILENLNIIDLKGKKASLLSGGEKQRVAIARALVKKPMLIIADEPTGNLDSENADTINRLFKEITGGGTSIIVVTHSDRVFLDVNKSYEIKQGMLV